MPDLTEQRPNNRETEYEEEKPRGEGRPPISAYVPSGAEGSTDSGKTATNPATGEHDAPMRPQTNDAGPQALRDEVPKTG
jgi:hypothetical protein